MLSFSQAQTRQVGKWVALFSSISLRFQGDRLLPLGTRWRCASRGKGGQNAPPAPLHVYAELFTFCVCTRLSKNKSTFGTFLLHILLGMLTSEHRRLCKAIATLVFQFQPDMETIKAYLYQRFHLLFHVLPAPYNGEQMRGGQKSDSSGKEKKKVRLLLSFTESSPRQIRVKFWEEEHQTVLISLTVRHSSGARVKK